MFKKIFFISVIFLSFSSLSQAAELKNFQINPDYLFTDEDLGVKFTVTVVSQGSEKPKNIILVETRLEGKVKYRWPLNDTGWNGDEKAGDGIYSREIQFKEKKPRTLVFFVLEQDEEGKGFGNPGESLPAGLGLRGELEIRAHPTFIDILKGAYEKIRAKWTHSGGKNDE